MRYYYIEIQDDWPRLLYLAEFAYMNSRHASTMCSPFKALYGYNPSMQLRVKDDSTEEKVPYAAERIKEIHKIREKLEERLRNAVD